MFVLLACLGLFAAASSGAAAAKRDFHCPLVDQQIGTGGYGFGIGSTPMGAQAPFGAVRVGPDTCSWDDIAVRWRHFGGYYHGDNHIRCFSHTHMVGSGVEDLGAIGVMPVRSSGVTKELVTSENFRSKFSHDHESNSCGYYKVDLLTWNIEAELAATTHVGVHRYLFRQSNGKDSHVMFPVSHSMNSKSCAGSSIMIDPAKKQVSGWMIMKGSLSGRLPGGLKTFFVARFLNSSSQFSVSPSGSGTWVDENVAIGNLSTSSPTSQNVGGFIQLESQPGDLTVEMAVAISYISVEQAELNMETELRGLSSFDAVHSRSTSGWEDTLGQVKATGGSKKDQVKFYTSMYHAHLAPSTWSEASGNYLGWDHKLHNLKESGYSDIAAFYTDMSIWDIHRTQMPMLGLLQPDVLRDSVRSLLLADKQGGDIPRW
jgi:predicted alpha-1,2-mannosidase